MVFDSHCGGLKSRCREDLVVGVFVLAHNLFGTTKTSFGFLAFLEAFSRNDFALVLKALDQIVVFPAKKSGQIAKTSEFAVGFGAEDFEGFGDHDAFDFVVWVGDTFENFEALQGRVATFGLVWDHAADGAEENFAGGAFMEGTTGGVGVHPFAHEGGHSDFVSENGTRNVDFFASDDDDRLADEQLFGNHRGKPAHQVGTSINDNFSLTAHHV
jgi:hypothetical protein